MTRIDQRLQMVRLSRSAVVDRLLHRDPAGLDRPGPLISVSTNFCRYSGDLRSPATGSARMSCIRVFTAGVLMVATVAACSLPTIAADVPLGKNEANQFEASKLVNPCSCADAWSGSPGERSRVRIAIALTILL